MWALLVATIGTDLASVRTLINTAVLNQIAPLANVSSSSFWLELYIELQNCRIFCQALAKPQAEHT